MVSGGRVILDAPAESSDGRRAGLGRATAEVRRSGPVR